MNKPTYVKEIIREYLVANGCVGLHRYQCACVMDELIRCQDGEAFGCAPTTPTTPNRRLADRRVSNKLLENRGLDRRSPMVNRRKPND